MEIDVRDVLTLWTRFLGERGTELAANVSTADSFDPENPPSTAQKDAYFAVVNEDGRILFHNGQACLADQFYGDLLPLLKTAIEARQLETPLFRLNKGQIYMNYGIAQLVRQFINTMTYISGGIEAIDGMILPIGEGILCQGKALM